MKPPGDGRVVSPIRGGRGRPKQRNGHPGWQPWELELLGEPDIPLKDVAVLVGRTEAAVRHKASRLGLVNIRDYHLRGDAHPNFCGGISPSSRTWRGKTWPEVRRIVLDRDGFTCQDGKEFIPSGSGLVVHHVIPYRLHPTNDPVWLTTLCVSHHMRRPEHWWRAIPSDIEELLLGTPS